jgi:exonuclease III
MRIISWNINGLRAILAKNMQRFFPGHVLVLCNIRSDVRSQVRGKIRSGMFPMERRERGGG